ncbi:hypothetical protein [Streptomyces sp. B1-3]|uniref:hypothetical protein n=1 Tax=Streptomyces sp. B1-3 TaxID=3141453 RepID=UPI003D2BAED1
MRRFGASPGERGTLSGGTCPDIFELSDRKFPVYQGQRLPGLQRTFPETVPILLRRGQTHHAYCTHCFHWPYDFTTAHGLARLAAALRS